MAKADWLTLEPTSGQGNATVVNSATYHTGREQRTTTVTAVAAGVSPNKTYTVIQHPTPEFVSFDMVNGSHEVTVGKEGGSLTLKGKSNSAKLTFSIVDNAEGTSNDLSLSLPANYEVVLKGALQEVPNGEAISGDPGASAEYGFNITFTDIAPNLTANELQCVLRVDLGGSPDHAQFTIKQAPGGSTFSFKHSSVLLDKSGTSQSQEIESDTSWELE